MKKRWKMILAAALAVLVVWMLWPRNLGAAFDTEGSLAVSVTIFGVTDGRVDNQTEEYRLPAGSEKGKRIGELLAQRSYHLTLGTLTGKDVIEGHTVTIHFYNGKGTPLSLTGGGRKELFLNHRVYRLGYWGADRDMELCEELLAVLREP